MSTTLNRLSDEPLGEVTIDADALQVVFHRSYRRPIEKVWAAITVPARLADWLANAEIEMKVGGAIRLDWFGHNRMVGRIVALDPPRTFAWTWTLDGRETVVRFDLEADGDGCRLILTHSGLSPRAGSGGGVRAGWHSHLAGIDEAIAGRKTAWETIIARRDAIADAYPSLPA
jgi:uncharacterized protein YndB with AHSA1/START domain